MASRRFHVWVWFSALFMCAPYWATGQGIATETGSVFAVPPVVRATGILKDSGGNPRSGAIGITFGIYSQPTGGAPLWQETRSVQLDEKGGYSILLGVDTVGGIPLEVFRSGQRRWLSVQPSGEPEQPRRFFAAVPYALQAGNSETLGGLPPSAFLRADPNSAANTSSASPLAVGIDSSAQTPVIIQQQGGIGTPSGTTNQIPKFITSSSFGNSQIQDATGVVSLQNLEHFVFADRFSGADIGAKINAAISSLGQNGGTVVVPAGAYTKVTTTVKVSHFNISIVGSGSNATQIDYVGTGDFIRVQMPNVCSSCVAPQAGKISGLTINGTASGRSGIHIGDVIGAQLDDVVIQGFTGAAAAGIWFDNVTSFTERIQITRVWANQNTKGVRFTNSGGTASQISFGYERILDLRVDVGPFQTGISVESGNLYHSVITAVINVDRNHSGTAVAISGLGYVGGVGTQVDDNLYDLLAECTQCGGTATFLSIGAGTSLTGTGLVDAYAMTNSIDPSATVFLYSPFIAGAPTAASSGLPVYMRGQPLGTNPDVPGAWVVPNGGPPNNWLMGFGNNVFWNGSAWQFHGDGVNNGGSAILGSYGDTDLGIYIVPSTGGTNQTVASGDLPKYEVANISAAGITINGNLTVTGTIAKGAGSFKIDHPLDPANSYLSHSFVESPDMMNIYNGNVTTDKAGIATVTLPTYFEALNRDFRYQLTVMGQFSQAIVDQEIRDNQFTIRTDHPFVRVSWQVTGVRHDAYAEAHRIPVEQSKPASERGRYLHPELFRAPSSSTTPSDVRPSY